MQSARIHSDLAAGRLADVDHADRGPHESEWEPLDASQLRMEAARREAEAREKRRQAREQQRREHEVSYQHYLQEHLTPEEIAGFRRQMRIAVEDGRYEAMVYRFPSDLCTDSGRAINNGAAHWPATLRGKAKAFYESYLVFGKPRGYRIKAMIISYPGGMPGDVGVFLSWE